MEDITRLNYKEVMRRLEMAKAKHIQIVNNGFGFIWPDSNLHPDEIIRGSLFVLNGENFVEISAEDHVSRKYVSFSQDFIVVKKCYSNRYEIYVRDNTNNILNKLRQEVRDDYYEIQLNEGIILMYSDTRLFAISKTGHLRQIDKGDQDSKSYYVLPSKKNRFAYDIYKNNKLLTTLDINLQAV